MLEALREAHMPYTSRTLSHGDRVISSLYITLTLNLPLPVLVLRNVIDEQSLIIMGIAKEYSIRTHNRKCQEMYFTVIM